MLKAIEFGPYLNKLRTSKGLALRSVAEKLGIDISLLSKIEHGERQIQPNMLRAVAELFELDYRELQIQFLTQKFEAEYGAEPYAKEALQKWIEEKR